MIYWTKKKSDVSIRYRAYKSREAGNIFNDEYILLDKDSLAEVYIFLSKENHGSCMGMIKGYSLTHFESKEEAFDTISKQLIENEGKKV